MFNESGIIEINQKSHFKTGFLVWCGLWDDFRTLRWLEYIKYPELLMK